MIDMVITSEVKGKPYTDFEDKLLLAQVGHVPVRVMAEGLGRTLRSVYERLKVLRRQGRYPSNVKYKTPPRARIRPETDNYRYFTDEEDRNLCTLFGWFSLNAIAKFINRLPASVESRVRYLRRQGKLNGRAPYCYQKFRPWTEEEVRYLTTNYGRLETSQIAETLNRAITAVERKASALSVRFRKQNYTAREVALLLGVRWENMRRWVNEGLITGFDSGDKSMHYYRFTYRAIATFVQEWPGFYDPGKIRYTPLNKLAMKVKESNEYLSIKQAAKLTGVPYYRLSYHLRRGNLRGLLILGPIAQRNWRIRKDDLEEWIENSSLRQALIRRPTTARVFGEEIDIWPARCTRNLQCGKCYFEGRQQCRPSNTAAPLVIPKIIRWKPRGYLTVKEYSQRHDYSTSWIYELIKQGGLVSLRKGKRIFISEIQ